MEKYKIYMTPCSLLLLLSICVLLGFYHTLSDSYNIARVLMVLIALPQMLSYLALLIYTTIYPDTYYSKVPSFLAYALFAVFIVVGNIVFLVIMVRS